MKMLASILLLLFTGYTFAADMPREVLLATNISQKKSAQTGEPGDLSLASGSIDHVKCVLDHLQVKYQIRSLPWRRARQDVRVNVLDGFFPAVATDQANDYATFSAPLVLENWYWFWRTDMPAPASWKEHFQIGVILGSQQESVLTGEGYHQFVPANNLEQLIKLLFSKRVDVVLLDKEQFEAVIKKTDLHSRDYRSRFFRYVPLGVYFGANFLTQYPDFLATFNNKIGECLPDGFDLSPSEKENIKKNVAGWLQQIKTHKDVLTAIAKQNQLNQSKSQSQLAQLDARWQEAFKIGDPGVAKAIINQPVSQFLRQIQEDTKGLLSEIIVTDERGYNVAVANMTSDYWQGDEEKFLQVVNKPEQTFYFDSIKYDASAKRFQVQVSSPIVNAKSQKTLGVVTLGLDLDKALSLQN